MITPLMHVLSCLDENYEVDKPVDILHLSKSDRDVIIAEARSLCSTVLNPDIVCMMDDHVYPVQYSGDNSIDLNIYTVALLERIQQCARHYIEHLKDTGKRDSSDDDLSTQATILRLEGNPDHIYYYVYKVMETAALSYDAKIAKLSELLAMLNAHGGEKLGRAVKDSELPARLELHSQLGYWKAMLMSDIMRNTLEMPTVPFTKDTIGIMRGQLAELGIYGFVNPLKMYQDFSSSRVTRKVTVNIPDKVLIFLSKVVQAGGGRIYIEDGN